MEVSKADSTQTKVSSVNLDELCREDSNDSDECYFFDHFFDDWETNDDNTQSSVISSSNLCTSKNAEENSGQEYELNIDHRSGDNCACSPTDKNDATTADDKDVVIGVPNSAIGMEEGHLMSFVDSSVNTNKSMKESDSDSVKQLCLKVSIPLKIYQNQLPPADYKKKLVQSYVSGDVECNTENTSCTTNLNAEEFGKTNVMSADCNDNVIQTANRNATRKEFVAMTSADVEPLKEISNISSPNATLKIESEEKELFKNGNREGKVRIVSSTMLSDKSEGKELLNSGNTEGKVRIVSSPMMGEKRSKFDGSILKGENDCDLNEIQTFRSIKGSIKKERDNRSRISLWKSRWIKKQRRRSKSKSASSGQLSNRSESEDYRSRSRERGSRSSQRKPRSRKHNAVRQRNENKKYLNNRSRSLSRSKSRSRSWSKSTGSSIRSRSRKRNARSRSRSSARQRNGNKKYPEKWSRSLSRSESRSRSQSKSVCSRSLSISTVRQRNGCKKYSVNWSRSQSKSESRSRSWSKGMGDKDSPLVRDKRRRTRNSRKGRSLIRDMSVSGRHSKNRSKSSSSDRSSHCLKRYRGHSRSRSRSSLESYRSRRSHLRRSTSSSARQQKRSSRDKIRTRTRERNGNSSRQRLGRKDPKSRDIRTESSPHEIIGGTDSCPNWSSAPSPYWQPSAYPLYPVMPVIQNTAPMPHQMANVQSHNTQMYAPSPRDPRLATSVLSRMQLPLNSLVALSRMTSQSQTNCSLPTPVVHSYAQVLAECLEVIIKHLPMGHKANTPAAGLFQSKLLNVNRKPVKPINIQLLNSREQQERMTKQKLDQKLKNNESPFKKVNCNSQSNTIASKQKSNINAHNPIANVKEVAQFKQVLVPKLENNSTPFKKINQNTQSISNEQKCNIIAQKYRWKKEAVQFKQMVAQKLEKHATPCKEINCDSESKTLSYKQKSNITAQKSARSSVQLDNFSIEEGLVKVNDITKIQSSMTECNIQNEGKPQDVSGFELATHRPWYCGPACESLSMCQHVYNAIQTIFRKGIFINVPSTVARKPSVFRRFHPSFHFSTIHLPISTTTSVLSDVETTLYFKSTRSASPPASNKGITFHPTKTTSLDASSKHLDNPKLTQPPAAETTCLSSLNSFTSPLSASLSRTQEQHHLL